MGQESNSKNAATRRNFGVLVLLPVLAAIAYRFCVAASGPQLSLDESNVAPSYQLLTQEQVAEYKSCGFVVVRGLFSPQQRDALIQAGEDYYNQFSVFDFMFAAAFAKLGMQIWRNEQQFAQAALMGALPAIAAQLLDEPKSVRLLKDGFFGFRSNKNSGCGFHQDDRGFWPSTDSTTGVNFWIALSEVSASEGGGIRVVDQSALDPNLAQECLDVIRPPNATTSSYAYTCRMHELHPTCHDTLMKVSKVHDLAPGDALIWDRHTFHRSEPFKVAVEEPKLRYTVRYVPNNAIAEGMLHPSVESGQVFDTPFHPQVWPSLLREEKIAIEQGLGSDMPVLPIMYRMIKRKLLG